MSLAAVRSKAVIMFLLIRSIVGFCMLYVTLWPFLFCNHPDGEERAGYFALFVFLVARDWCVALPHAATGLSAVCDCVIS